jgi:hypothetical protein
MAQGFRFANPAAVQNQRIGCGGPLVGRKRGTKMLLGNLRVFTLCDPKAIGDPNYVPIDWEARHAKRVAEHDIRRLSPDTWQHDQFFHRRRYRTGVMCDERRRHCRERPGFRAKEPGRFDERFDLLRRSARQRLRIGIAGEEIGGDLVDARVGALCRENRSDKQLKGIPKVQLGERRRMLLLEDRDDSPYNSR